MPIFYSCSVTTVPQNYNNFFLNIFIFFVTVRAYTLENLFQIILLYDHITIKQQLQLTSDRQNRLQPHKCILLLHRELLLKHNFRQYNDHGILNNNIFSFVNDCLAFILRVSSIHRCANLKCCN